MYFNWIKKLNQYQYQLSWQRPSSISSLSKGSRHVSPVFSSSNICRLRFLWRRNFVNCFFVCFANFVKIWTFWGYDSICTPSQEMTANFLSSDFPIFSTKALLSWSQQIIKSIFTSAHLQWWQRCSEMMIAEIHFQISDFVSLGPLYTCSVPSCGCRVIYCDFHFHFKIKFINAFLWLVFVVGWEDDCRILFWIWFAPKSFKRKKRAFQTKLKRNEDSKPFFFLYSLPPNMYFSYWSFLRPWFLILCNKCFTTPKCVL